MLVSLLNRHKRTTVNLPHGARGHWIGDSNAKKVLVYYHGMGKQVSTGKINPRQLTELS